MWENAVKGTKCSSVPTAISSSFSWHLLMISWRERGLAIPDLSTVNGILNNGIVNMHDFGEMASPILMFWSKFMHYGIWNNSTKNGKVQQDITCPADQLWNAFWSTTWLGKMQSRTLNALWLRWPYPPFTVSEELFMRKTVRHNLSSPRKEYSIMR